PFQGKGAGLRGRVCSPSPRPSPPRGEREGVVAGLAVDAAVAPRRRPPAVPGLAGPAHGAALVPVGPAPFGDARPVRALAERLAVLEPAGPRALLAAIAEPARLLHDAVGVPEGPRALLHAVPVLAVEERPAAGVVAPPATVLAALDERAVGPDPAVLVPGEVGAVVEVGARPPAPLRAAARIGGPGALRAGRGGAGPGGARPPAPAPRRRPP